MKEQILRGMALAFFASAWADMVEENGASLSGLEIMQVMPETVDPAAKHAAYTLYFQMESVNGDAIERLYGQNCGEPRLSPQDWGHYAAMQAMGHGVGLGDYGIGCDAVQVPYIEFSQCSLEKDYTYPAKD
jgi:hypothetical protein